MSHLDRVGLREESGEIGEEQGGLDIGVDRTMSLDVNGPSTQSSSPWWLSSKTIRLLMTSFSAFSTARRNSPAARG